MMDDRGPTRRNVLTALGFGGLAAGLIGGRRVWNHFDIGNRLFNPVDIHAFVLKPVVGVKRPDGAEMPGFSSAELRGQVSILHGFGSWCPDCRAEHPGFMAAVRAHGLRIYGLDFLDDDAKAAAYLSAEGNPFHALGADPTGNVTRAFGIRGVPSTVVLDKAGNIALALPGPLSEASVNGLLLPKLAALT